MTQHTFRKFIPLLKVEEASDGSTRAYGIVTGQSPDKEGEICDYDFAKNSYQEWSEEAAAATKAAGQEISLGNIRLQHTLQIAGKAIQLDFDDKKKLISLGSQTEDPTIQKLLKGGYVRGYSQGGAYAFRKCNTCETDIPDKEDGSKSNYCPKCQKNVHVRYGPVISEVSYVDNPCFKKARFSMVKGAKFQLVKADGSTELQGFAEGDDAMQSELMEKLEALTAQIQKALSKDAKTKRVAGEDLTSDCFAYVGDKDDTSTWKLPIKFSTDAKTKSHVRNALARFNQTKGIPADEKAKVKAKIVAAAKKHGIEVSDEADKAMKSWVDGEVNALIEKTAEKKGLKKGMYEVSRLADLLQSLAYIRVSTEYEREREGDESTLPEDLQEELESLAECFLAMAQEESTELTEAADQAGKTGGPLYMSDKTAGLEKAARKSVAEHAKTMKASISDHCDKVTKAMSEHKDAMCSHVDKLCKILGAEETGEKGDAPNSIDPTKEGTENTLKTAIASLQKTVEDLKKGPAATPAAQTTEQYVSLGKTADGVEVFKKVAPAAAAAPAVTGDEKPITKADLDKAIETAFNAGIQAVIKAQADAEDEADGGADEKDEKDGKKKVSKAAAGIGDRTNTTLLNGGPVLRIMPVYKAKDEVVDPAAAAAAAAAAAPPADVSKAMSGDVTEALKLMKSAKPAELPPTVAVALSSRR